MSFVKVTQDGALATVTIDRPQSLNALNAEVLQELKNIFAELKCRVMILTGAGPKAFVAGADIAAMSNFGPREARQFVELGQSVIRALEDAPFISIAAVNGFALGGGCELAMGCDLIYVSESAKMGLPETNLGIIPGFGGTANLVSRVGYPRALEMILTGKMLNASETKEVGLSLDVFKAEDLIPRVTQIAEGLAKKGTMSLQAARRLVKGVSLPHHERAFLLEKETFGSLFATSEPKEGMKAFLEKRDPRFHSS